jgi:hypothetical protein
LVPQDDFVGKESVKPAVILQIPEKIIGNQEDKMTQKTF